jgi:transposase-like protein
MTRFLEFAEAWEKKYPAIVRLWARGRSSCRS